MIGRRNKISINSKITKTILIVGDKPSSKNLDPKIPFVGTPSYKKLLEWLNFLNIKDYKLVNTVDEVFSSDVEKHKFIIALGNNASKSIKKEHYKLPHPSPRNRLLNNKILEFELLQGCKKWFTTFQK